MSRPVLALCAVLAGLSPAPAADPAPLWEVDVPGAGDRSTAPGWVGFSPDGGAVVAVVVREGGAERTDFAHTLRVWDAGTRKERFTADLGRGRAPTWGGDLAAFQGDDTVLTGGQTLTVRHLGDGRTMPFPSSYAAPADHTVWSAPDVRETYHLHREPDREGRPVELVFRPSGGTYDEFSRGRVRGDNGPRRTGVRPPRDGLSPQAVVMNPGRSQLAAAFRDDPAAGAKARHALVLYGVRTVDEFALDPVAEAVVPVPVCAAAFARDGRTLAAGGEDGSVSLWDVGPAGPGWKPRATVGGGGGRVGALAFSPDWRVVAAATWDGKKPNLLLIDADAGSLVRSVRVDHGVTAVAWSPDGRVLVTGGYGGKLRAWDAAALLSGN